MLQSRPVTPSDDSFLYQVYTSTRHDEVAAWGWDTVQQEAFLRMQYGAQRSSYQNRYPEAEHRVVFCDDMPVGRIMTARTESALVLVDISLLPEFQGAGIGTALIRDLQARAAQAGLPVTLHVLATNPARRLYERLGFILTGEPGIHLAMLWRPDPAQST